MTKKRILVVDDDLGVFETIQTCLEENYELFHANNGREGLDMYKKIDPALVILDIRMPVMNGAEFLEKICITPDDLFSVIVLTGHTSGAEIERLFNMGITAFLRKPFDFFELKGQVKQCILSKAILAHLTETNRHLLDHNNDLEITLAQREEQPSP